MKLSLQTLVLVTICVQFACREDPSGPQQPGAPPTIQNAVYILNEGNYGDPTGARLSVYDLDRGTVYTDVYEAANNNAHLGSTGDDMKIVNGKGYILMSGSENLNVISLTNNVLLQSANYPTDAPHDLLIDSTRNRAYVTRLYKASILVLNLSSLAVVDSISVGNNPQGLAIAGDYLFVCNSGYGSSRTVSVIDVRADTVKSTLTLADGPTGATVASDGRLWVACTGNALGTPATNGKIFIINTLTLAVEDSITFSENLWGNIVMGVDGYAYVLGIDPTSFFGGPLHRISLTAKTVSLSFVSGVFYGMAVDIVTGDLYLADAKNLSTNGEVLIYLNNGTFKKRFAAQRGPSVIVFKR